LVVLVVVVPRSLVVVLLALPVRETPVVMVRLLRTTVLVVVVAVLLVLVGTVRGRAITRALAVLVVRGFLWRLFLGKCLRLRPEVRGRVWLVVAVGALVVGGTVLVLTAVAKEKTLVAVLGVSTRAVAVAVQTAAALLSRADLVVPVLSTSVTRWHDGSLREG
jgi:hypothetical protein